MTWRIPCRIRKAAYWIAVRCIWGGSDRPRAMLAAGRPPLQDFDGDEPIFFRWFSNYFDDDGQIRRDNIPIPDLSVNRTKHGGRCWHVLIPEPEPEHERTERNLCTGIIRFHARCLPIQFEHGGHTFLFALEHDPLVHNYSHCEIRVYRDDIRIKKREEFDKGTGKVAKKFYRNAMFEAARLILRPEVSIGRTGP